MMIQNEGWIHELNKPSGFVLTNRIDNSDISVLVW